MMAEHKARVEDVHLLADGMAVITWGAEAE